MRAHAPTVRRADKTLDLDATLAGIAPLVEAGATSIAFALAQFVRHKSEIPKLFERLGAWNG